MPSPLFEGMGETFMGVLKERATATFSPQVGPAVPGVPVIFNSRFADQDINGVPIGAPRPVAWFLTGAITAKHGDTLTINSVNYKVRSTEPDGHEMTKVELSV